MLSMSLIKGDSGLFTSFPPSKCEILLKIFILSKFK